MIKLNRLFQVAFFALTLVAYVFVVGEARASGSSSVVYPRAVIVTDRWDGSEPVATASSIASQLFNSKSTPNTSVAIRGFPALPPITTLPANRVSIVSLAKSVVDSSIADYASRVASKLLAEQQSIAIIDVNRDLPAVYGRARRISFPIVVYSSGKYVYGTPDVHDGNVSANTISSDTLALEVIYVPSVPAPGVPSAWRFDPLSATTPVVFSGGSTGGVVKWRRKQLSTGVAVDAWTDVPIGTPAFDATFVPNGTAQETTFAARCLIDQSYVSPLSGATCANRTGQPFVDLRTLMGAVDAKFLLLDYIEPMRPSFSASASTAGTSNAGVSVNITSRTIYLRCDASGNPVPDSTMNPNYLESGSFAYQIDRKATRYFAGIQSGDVLELAQSRDALPIASQTYSAGANLTTVAEVNSIRNNAVALTHMVQWRAAAAFPEGQPSWGPVNVITNGCGPVGGNSIVVSKVFTGDTAGMLFTPSVTVEASCSVSGTRAVTFRAPATGTFSNVIVGESCSLSETAIQSGSLATDYSYGSQVWPTGSNVSVVAGTNSRTVRNPVIFSGGPGPGPGPGPSGAELRITKVITDTVNALATEPVITVRASCTTSGIRSVAFSRPNRGVISGLVAGESCNLIETTPDLGASNPADLARGFRWASSSGRFTPSSTVTLVAGTNDVTVTNVTEAIPVDRCSNIAGEQPTVPSGMIEENNVCFSVRTVRLCTCDVADVTVGGGPTFEANRWGDLGDLSQFTGNVTVRCLRERYLGNAGQSGVWPFINGTRRAINPYPWPGGSAEQTC